MSPRTLTCAAVLALVLGVGPVSGVEPAVVGDLRVVVTDIYGADEVGSGLVGAVHGAMNALHPGTRRHVIDRELLMAPGDPFDPELLAETERNLRSLGFLTNVSVVAVDTLPDGTVPVEVRVQETWSLSTQVAYSRSSSADRWTLLVADGNFLGYGVKLEAGLGEDEDRSWQQLRLENRRLLGSDLRLSLVTADLSDGHTRSFGLSRPFYAQDDAWSFDVQGWDMLFEPRWFLRRSATDLDGDDRLYATPPVKREGLSAVWIRRLSPAGQGRLWRVGAGLFTEHLALDLDDPVDTSDDVLLDAAAFRSAAGRGLARIEGRTAQLVFHVETLGRDWAKARYVTKLGPEEDLLLDPWLRLRAGPVLDVLGGDVERLAYELKLQDWSAAAGGWLFSRVEALGAFGGPEARWHLVEALAGWHGGSGDGLWRLWAEGVIASDAPGTEVPVLGLTRGLRTLEYDGMAGDRLVRWNAEHVRLVPGELLGFYRLGVAVFASGGSAWWRDDPADLRTFRHEAGIGLRFGPTRSSRADVARLDLAWPLDGSGGARLTAATGGTF